MSSTAPNKATQQSTIGVFDSGVGGISVLRHIHQRLPNERLVYAADSLYAPYGGRSATEICQRSHYLTEFLLRQQAKVIVVACNTATAAAVASLRERFDVPIIGMEPAVKPAVAATRNGVVGVMATTGTLNSARFAALLEHYGQGIKVVTQSCPGLVECVESGALDTPMTLALVRQYLEPLLTQGADTIVLGCTHYPFLRPLIEREAGPDVTIIDTGAAVARQVQRQLANNGMQNNNEPSVTFWTTSNPVQAAVVIKQLWGQTVTVGMLE